MPTPICLRCLSRALRPIEASLPSNGSSQRAALSTSAPLSAAKPAPKQGAARTGAKTGKRLQLRKTVRSSSGRPVAPGERKAYRKRIVLSNTNALEVQGLQDLTADKLVRGDGEVALNSQRGRVLGLTNETVDALRALETFQPTQGWSLFRRPATLVRQETVLLADDVADITGEEKKTSRMVLDGRRGSGKSVLLLQAQTMALLKGCVVIHLAEGQEIINAHTSYQPIDTPEGTKYIQPHYTAHLLSNIAKANQSVLSKLRLSKKHDLPVPIQANMSLARFAELGAQDQTLAWPIWQALWSELLAPSQPDAEGLRRPPVMVSMDGLNHVMRNSAYLNAEAKPIHAHDLMLVQTFTDFLSGSTALPNGGMVLGATCASNKPASATLDHTLEVLSTPEGQTPPEWNPYVKKDDRVAAALKGVEVMKLKGLSKAEARGVLEYYAQSGMVRSTVTEGMTSERWTLAGGGIVGELEKGVVRMRFAV